jgi:hypothetical protein
MTALSYGRVSFACSATSALVFAIGCDARGGVWDQAFSGATARGLDASVALVDPLAERALMLTVTKNLELEPTSLPIGRGFAAAETTPDLSRLVVLCRGDVPRVRPDDQRPSLSVLGGATAPRELAAYTLGDPLSGLAIDPEGRFAIAHPTEDDVSFIQNPNELNIVDLSTPAGANNPVPVTLRSFGGRPRAFTFTPTLGLPGGPGRLLVVQTDRDVAVLDLGDLSKPDITIKLTSTGQKLEPVQVAVSDGETDRDDDARLAIRVKGDSSVLVVDLLPVSEQDAKSSPHAFRALPNLVDVGGASTDVGFVRTDGGLRLAALVPSREALVLVDPATGIGADVALGAAFERMSLVTNVVGATDDGSDVALLWSTSSPNVAFVALGTTIGTPYKSVDRLELADPAASVLDVPAPHEDKKLLEAPAGRSFVVLDLLSRTAYPLLASANGAHAFVSPDGLRAWMTAPGEAAIAFVDLENLHPRNIALTRGASGVFDIARVGGGRAAIAVHPIGGFGITVLDAENPALETARSYSGLLLGGIE